MSDQEEIAALTATVAQQRQQIADLTAALTWFVNLANDVGKAGGRPEPGEWEACTEAGRRALASLPEGPRTTTTDDQDQ